MKNFEKIFLNEKPVIAMIHVAALPGTPRNSKPVQEIVGLACREAELYSSAGVDAVMIENMHDVPYLKRDAGPEITAAMSVIGYEIKRTVNKPVGIQILAGANKQSLAAAYAAGLDFIRAEGFVFAHTADEGLIQSDAGELLRYRKQIGAEEIAVFTDIKKKHSSHAITEDVTILETAKAAEFFLSDGVIITGSATGEKPNKEELELLKDKLRIPVLIGSGLTDANIAEYFGLADGFIVGSNFKIDGDWKNSIDAPRVNRFMDKIHSLK